MEDISILDLQNLRHLLNRQKLTVGQTDFFYRSTGLLIHCFHAHAPPAKIIEGAEVFRKKSQT